MKFSRGTKILHLIIIMTVTMQVLSQFWMFVPTPDKLPPVQWMAWLYVTHLVIGMLVLCFVGVRLVMILEDEEYAKRLYPWFDKLSFSRFVSEFKQKPAEEESRIASVVHGLGLMVLLGLGTTGVFFFLGLAPNGYMDASTAFLRSTHEVLAILLWFFLAGHIGMYIRHRLSGRKSIQNIFNFKDK